MKTTHAHGLLFGITIALTFAIGVPLSSSAQTTLTEATAAIVTLSANPQSPRPNQAVTLSLASYTTNLSTATISWYVDGVLKAKGVGQTTFSATSGKAGSAHSIRASVVAADGSNAEATLAIRPATVALLYEAATYTPPFYRGRALASANAPIRVHADAQFTSSGAQIPASGITYTWSVNGHIMQNLSGVGKSDLTLSGPSLYGALIISVDASTANGATRATQSIRIPAVVPVADLYSDDALLGVQYRNAITNAGSVRSDQATLVAEPYYFAVSDPKSFDLIYSWRVNGAPVLSDQGSPSRITLQVTGGGEGTASVALSLASTLFSFESTKDTWQVHVTPNAARSPFTTTK